MDREGKGVAQRRYEDFLNGVQELINKLEAEANDTAQLLYYDEVAEIRKRFLPYFLRVYRIKDTLDIRWELAVPKGKGGRIEWHNVRRGAGITKIPMSAFKEARDPVLRQAIEQTEEAMSEIRKVIVQLGRARRHVANAYRAMALHFGEEWGGRAFMDGDGDGEEVTAEEAEAARA